MLIPDYNTELSLHYSTLSAGLPGSDPKTSSAAVCISSSSFSVTFACCTPPPNFSVGVWTAAAAVVVTGDASEGDEDDMDEGSATVVSA